MQSLFLVSHRGIHVSEVRKLKTNMFEGSACFEYDELGVGNNKVRGKVKLLGTNLQYLNKYVKMTKTDTPD